MIFFVCMFFFFFFKQKTAYEMRISDWSSDVCSSDLLLAEIIRHAVLAEAEVRFFTPRGEGKAVMQRVRMELSRSRQRNERKGKRNLRFSLHQSIYPWTTLDGKRLERVLVTSTRSPTHPNLELLDDLL